MIADIDGFFRIPIEYRDRGDTLKITSIGYQTKLVPLQALDEETLNIISMNESVESLSQVVVKGRKRATTGGPIDGYYVNDIIRLAIENIPNNYPTEGHSYVGYYRDYQIRDEEYINLNEALIELFDKGFLTDKYSHIQNQMALYSYKPNYEFARDTTTTIAYNNIRKEYNIKVDASAFGSNEMGIVNHHDPIRNYNNRVFSFIDVLEKDFLKNHFFVYEGEVELDGIRLYHIKFNAKVEMKPKNYTSKGNIYIEKYNFAIHKLEYSGFNQKEAKAAFDLISPVVIKALPSEFQKNKVPFFKINIEYKRNDDKMCLNYISFKNTFDVTIPKLNMRVLKLKYEPNFLNALTFEYNEILAPSVLKNPKNYELSYGGKKLKIINIEIFDKSKVRVFFKPIKNGSLTTIKRSFSGLVKDELFKYQIKNVTNHDYDILGLIMKKITYNFTEKSFLVEFENLIDKEKIVNKDIYSIRYKNEIYKIKNVELTNKNQVQLFLDDEQNIIKLGDLTTDDFQNVICEIIGVPIKQNVYTYERTGEKIEQFREFFVQQVNIDKVLPNDLHFMNKSLPISKNPINKIKDNKQYWINTPLKAIKESQ